MLVLDAHKEQLLFELEEIQKIASYQNFYYQMIAEIINSIFELNSARNLVFLLITLKYPEIF